MSMCMCLNISSGTGNVYGDDIILASKSSTHIQEFIKSISESLDIKDMGKLHYFLGVKIAYPGARVCRPTLAFWHFTHIFIHFLTSVFIFGQTYRSVIKRIDAFAPGCDNLCTALNISFRKDAGTYGRSLSVLMSHTIFL